MLRNIQCNYVLVAIIIISLLSACKKQNIPVKPESSAFSAQLKNNAVFPATGGKDTIVVNGGTNGWWVTTPDNSWAVITKRYGSGDFKIPVSVNANLTGASREINVTVNPTFGMPPVSINIKQAN
jgi:hypothetical protein